MKGLNTEGMISTFRFVLMWFRIRIESYFEKSCEDTYARTANCSREKGRDTAFTSMS